MEGSLVFVAIFVFVSFISGTESTKFNIKNNCPYTIWPATQSNNNSPQLRDTGFALVQGATSSISAPAGWAGRIWARTYCSTDGSGRFGCPIGDCGTGQVTCNGRGGATPASLAQIVLNGSNGGAQDAYEVSLVDGFNLPVTIAPAGCQVSSCPVDINSICPSESAVRWTNGGAIGCKNQPQLFKEKCPKVFGSCPSGRDYLITFCP